MCNFAHKSNELCVMEFYRTILNDLKQWKNSPHRKPLLIRGARQIGKTWALKRFGEIYFENSVYINFEEALEIRAEFEKTKAPSRIIPILRTYLGQRIDAERTLIIFDEIQECNSALNSLKYFCEEAPEYHIIAAGSLLGVMLSKGDSFPVGKVDILDMYPLTFREFLWTAEKRMLDYIDSLDAISPLPQFVFNSLEELFRRYMICGGMPEAALAMLEGKEMSIIDKTLDNILASYAWDFAKHSQPNDTQRIAAIWQSLPSQLSKENRKFVYGVVKTGARAREYESALLWLEHAGLIIRSFCSSKPLLPLTAYDDLSSFKVYAGDVGLLRALAKLPNDAIFGESHAFVEFKGALMENYILQSLMCQFSPIPRYWMSSGTAEVDFVIQNELDIIPVEVKSGINLRAKSLKLYIERYSPTVALRFSRTNINDSGKVLDLPLFLADWTKQILEIRKSTDGRSK